MSSPDARTLDARMPVAHGTETWTPGPRTGSPRTTEARLPADPASRAAHREPLVWLVAGLPALTVVAGLLTVAIAVRGGDAVVVDEFRRDGLAIRIDTARDDAAERLGVAARIEFHAAGVAVRLETARPAPRTLLLLLSHATRADLDRLLTLHRAPDGTYRAALPSLERGRWHVELSPADRRWRLVGRFRDSVAALDLRPGARVAAAAAP
jgi:uncharacterized protein